MSRYWLIVTRVLLLLALGASATLYAYYIDPLDSSFCAAQSGCETLRRTPLAYFGSQYVSLPLFGMLAFVLAFAVSFWAQARESSSRYAVLAGMLSLGAAAAVSLLAYQAWVAKAFCWLCVVTDSTATVAAAASLVLYRTAVTSNGPQRSGLLRIAWLSLAALVIAAPLIWNAVRPLPPVPAPIRALYKSGMINVVEFEDLQCPHCRRLHPLLQKVIASYPGKVNFVRKHAPLPQHEYAEDAARAVICADQLAQRGNEMADRLVASELNPEIGTTVAKAMGLDQQQFGACLKAPTTQALLDEDLALIHEVGFEGLPTTYVGPERFVGTRQENEAAWRDAFERAARDDGSSGVPGPVFTALVLLIAAGVVVKGRALAR